MAVAQRLGLGEYCGVSIKRRQAHGFVITENRFKPGLEIPPHEHTYAHFTVVLDGGFTETYGDVVLECPAGSLLSVPSGMPHTDRMWDSGAHTLGVELGPKLRIRVDEVVGVLRQPQVVSERSLVAKIQRLYDEFRTYDSASLLSLESICLDLLVTASRSLGKADPKMPAWMPLVMEVLHDERDATLGELAEAAGVHETHLARTFRRIHGCTVGEYVRWLRLEEAKSALKDSGKPLAEIAVEAGFYDQAHFSRAFKQAYGTSPSAFRRTFG